MLWLLTRKHWALTWPMESALCLLFGSRHDSDARLCWCAGGTASEEASGGGVWRWLLQWPLWRSLGIHGNSGPQCHRVWGRLNMRASSPQQCGDNFELFDGCWWGFYIYGQILEYEDYKNETEPEYEEYEIYEDGYGFAEREGAETWDGEVNQSPTWPQNRITIKICFLFDYLLICLSSSGSPKSRERPEGRARHHWTGELLVALCWVISLVPSAGLCHCSPTLYLIVFVVIHRVL